MTRGVRRRCLWLDVRRGVREGIGQYDPGLVRLLADGLLRWRNPMSVPSTTTPPGSPSGSWPIRRSPSPGDSVADRRVRALDDPAAAGAAAAAVLRAARARRHVRRLPRPARRRRRAPRRAVLAQGRLLHRLRARHDRAGRLGGGHRPGPSARRRHGRRRHRRAVRAGSPRGCTATAGARSAVDFVNVPSYVLARDVPVPHLAAATVAVDRRLRRGHLRAASTPAASGWRWTRRTSPSSSPSAVRSSGRSNDSEHAGAPRRPTAQRRSTARSCYEDLGDDGDGRPHQRNVTSSPTAQVDRSPCGSGTAPGWPCSADQAAWRRRSPARARLDRRVPLHRPVLHHLTAGGRPAVVPRSPGTAYRTGEHLFVVDPADALVPGLRPAMIDIPPGSIRCGRRSSTTDSAQHRRVEAEGGDAPAPRDQLATLLSATGRVLSAEHPFTPGHPAQPRLLDGQGEQKAGFGRRAATLTGPLERGHLDPGGRPDAFPGHRVRVEDLVVDDVARGRVSRRRCWTAGYQEAVNRVNPSRADPHPNYGVEFMIMEELL